MYNTTFIGSCIYRGKGGSSLSVSNKNGTIGWNFHNCLVAWR